jgi:SAM-dependent methyltransferase
MTAWAQGYVTDSPYTFSYQPAQAPGHIAMVCAMAGVAWQPRPGMAVLDIGCGRGLTVNVLAAANPDWNVIGLDYNPAHIAEAQELAEAAELANAGFVEADLAAMTDAELDQLPELDVVTIHGVWTWVSDAVRAGIVRLLARRLKPGGVCYIGYNVLPGFGADAALQRLFRHLAALERTGTSPERAAAALETIRGLQASRPVHLANTPMFQRLTGDEPALDGAYLAHEFLTEHWRPVFFEDLAAALAGAKLEYVGSATMHENIPDMLFEEPQRRVHDSLPHGAPREFMKDLCLQRPFRRDVFIRGLRRVDRIAALDRLVLAAARPMPEESPKLVVPVGIAEMGPDLYAPMAAALNEGPQALGHLRHLPQGRTPNPAEVLAIFSGGMVLPALREGGPSPRTDHFNRVLHRFAQASGSTEGQLAMASPMAAGGLPCSWVELAVCMQPGITAPDADPVAITHRALPHLTEEQAPGAIELVTRMLAERLPIWRRFGVLPG